MSETTAFDKILFLDAHLAENNLCSICENVFRDPIQLPCGHKFCRLCITRSLANEQVCPLDGEAVRSYQLLPLSTTARIAYNGLRLQCDRCRLVTVLAKYENHRAGCDNDPDQPVECDRCLATTVDRSNHDCIKYLREKVEDLEKTRSEANGKIMDLRERIEILEANAGIDGKDTSEMHATFDSGCEREDIMPTRLELVESRLQEMDRAMRHSIVTICGNIGEIRREMSKDSDFEVGSGLDQSLSHIQIPKNSRFSLTNDMETLIEKCSMKDMDDSDS